MVLGIYGAGGSGRSFLNVNQEDKNTEQKWEEIIFVDDVVGVKEIDGRRVYTFKEVTEKFNTEQIQFLISLGEPALRKDVYEKVKKQGYSLYTFIDKQASVSINAKIGEGCVITSGVFIDNNVEIAPNCILYWGSIVGHDSYVGANSIISANSFIAGHCKLNSNVYMGPGSMMKDRIEIGENAIIALGAVVFKNVQNDFLACGNPARIIKRDKGKDLFN